MAEAVGSALQPRGRLKKKLWLPRAWLGKRKYARKSGLQLLLRNDGKRKHGRWMTFGDILGLSFGARVIVKRSARKLASVFES